MQTFQETYKKDLKPIYQTLTDSMQTNQPILAVYLTGSRMRYINRSDSDFDLTVIVPSTGEELIQPYYYHNEFVTDSNLSDGKTYSLDVRVWSIKKLYHEIKHNNLHTLEMLMNRPLYFNQPPIITHQMRYYTLFEDLANLREQLVYQALPVFYKAAKGLYKKSVFTGYIRRDLFKKSVIDYEYAKRLLAGNTGQDNLFTNLAGSEVQYLDQMSDEVLQDYAEKFEKRLKSKQKQVHEYKKNILMIS